MTSFSAVTLSIENHRINISASNKVFYYSVFRQIKTQNYVNIRNELKLSDVY